MTTSTAYTTTIRTITSCAPDVPNCPGGVHEVTETIPIYTTVCPVTSEPTGAMTTSTVYATDIYTVTSCAPGVPDCSAGHVTTVTRPVYTTVCPVGEDVSIPLVTSTAYTTEAYTVTACADDVDCSIGQVTTATRAFTTIHPAETGTVPKPGPEVIVAVPGVSSSPSAPSQLAPSQAGAAASTGFSHPPAGPSGTPGFPNFEEPSSASTMAVGLGGLMALVALQMLAL
jgi:chitinase